MRCGFRLSLRELLLATTLVAWLAYELSTSDNRASIVQTDRELDVALLGEGYFCVSNQLFHGGLGYTRRGRLALGASRELILDTGAKGWEEQLVIEPTICIPESAKEVRISPTGLVECTDRDTLLVEKFGRIQITRFAQPDALEQILPGVYLVTASSGLGLTVELTDGDRDLIKQGWIEHQAPGWGTRVSAGALGVGLVVLVAALSRRARQNSRVSIDDV